MKFQRVGVGVLIFNEQNQLFLGKRIASHGKTTWGIPGGHLEFGESFEACAKREILEETGLHVDSLAFFALTNDSFEEDQKHYVSIFMRAKCFKGEELRNLEPHKTETWKWFNQNDLPDNLFLPLKTLMSGGGYGMKGMLF